MLSKETDRFHFATKSRFRERAAVRNHHNHTPVTRKAHLLCGLEPTRGGVRLDGKPQPPCLHRRFHFAGGDLSHGNCFNQPTLMPTLATTVDGLTLPNPFVIGSGPPGTNLSVIQRAFREGWGAVIAKTISLDAAKVVNVTPRYAKLHAGNGEVIEFVPTAPWQNTPSRSRPGA